MTYVDDILFSDQDVPGHVLPEEPPYGDDIEFAPQERPRYLTGGAFAFDEPATVPSVWGVNQNVAWAEGEGLMLVGPDGVGKTAIQQQLLLARCGLKTDLLGFDVTPASKPVLYIAADRPRQAARSIRRMVAETDRKILDDRLIVWKGPLPFDLSTAPDELAPFVQDLGAGDIFIDALKDVALDLNKDESGSRINRAFQECIAAGMEICVSHHQRKELQAGKGTPKPTRLADVYGSRWLTAGMGSVILLWGEPGDLVVELSHLKQPAEDIGPFKVRHDHRVGHSTVFHPIDLEQLIADTYGGITVKQAASAIYDAANPSANQIEKARRRLENLCAAGRIYRSEVGTAAHYLNRHP